MPSRMMAFFVALIVLIGAAAHAQGPSGPSRGFGVSPPSIEVRVSAGAIATAEFTLWNSSDLRSEVYTIDVLDLSQLSTGTIRGVERGQGTRSCAEWLEVPSEVEIPPGGAKVVRLSLRCPPQTKGSYFAMLEVSVKRAESPAQMHVSVRPALSVTIEARVPGSATTHLEPMALQYHPTPEPALILTTKNTGVWRKPVEGDVLIYSGSSAFPMRVGLPYQASGKPYSLYPGMAIDQAIPLPKALRPGTHRVSVRLALTDAAQARKDFELEVAGGTAMSLAREGAKAETDVSLEVDPEVAELDLPPGGSRIVPVKVTNRDSRPASVRASVSGVRMESNGMYTFADSDEEARWITVQPEQFELAPGRMTTLRVKATVPKEEEAALPLVAAVRLETTAEKTEFHDDWRSTGEYPILILAQSPQASPAALKIASIDVIRISESQNPSAAVMAVTNEGDKTARVHGAMAIVRANDRAQVATMAIGGGGSEVILPGGERRFRMPFPPLDRGDYEVVAKLSAGSESGQAVSKSVAFEARVGVPDQAR